MESQWTNGAVKIVQLVLSPHTKQGEIYRGKNTAELNQFYTDVDETLIVIEEMRDIYKTLNEKYGSIHSNYNTLTKQV